MRGQGVLPVGELLPGRRCCTGGCPGTFLRPRQHSWALLPPAVEHPLRADSIPKRLFRRGGKPGCHGHTGCWSNRTSPLTSARPGASGAKPPSEPQICIRRWLPQRGGEMSCEKCGRRRRPWENVPISAAPAAIKPLPAALRQRWLRSGWGIPGGGGH
ncbi:unnamed protein product [Coccothraustes coccothraustes]